MTVKVKKENGVQTLIVKKNFNEVLDNNFDEIIEAIADKGKVLKELLALYEKDPKITDKIFQTIRQSLTPDDASDNLRIDHSMSKRLARYIIDLPLSTLTALSVQEIREQLAYYSQKIEGIKSFL